MEEGWWGEKRWCLSVDVNRLRKHVGKRIVSKFRGNFDTLEEWKAANKREK